MINVLKSLTTLGIWLVPCSALADSRVGLEPLESVLSQGGSLEALPWVFLAGVATSLTPCVYPMVALTVSVFGAHRARSRWHAAGLSLCFVLGIASLFTPLGLGAALTGNAFGAFLSSPAVVLLVAAVFVLLALMALDLVPLNLPPGLQNRLAAVGGVGPLGAFALGLVSALVAAPCTGPALAFMLTWIGTTADVTFGAVALFTYALGLGLLFFLVGTFAIALPKSGPWMGWTKSIMAIVMLVMAVWFVRDLVPAPVPTQRSTPWLVAGAALALMGIALGAIHVQLPADTVRAAARKAVGMGLTVLGLVLCLAYLEALPAGAKIPWRTDHDRAVRLARASGRPLLVDFTASWCQVCQELESTTLSDPRVVAEVRRQNMISVRVDLSPGQDLAEAQRILRTYGHPGLPLLVVHRSDGSEATRFASFISPQVMVQALRTHLHSN